MTISDRFLWLIVAALGINIAQVNRSVFLKCFSVLMVSMFFIPSFHYLLGFISLFGTQSILTDSFFIAFLLNNTAIWYLFFNKRKATSASVLQLSKFQKKYLIIPKNSATVKTIAVFIVFFQVASCVLGLLSPVVDFDYASQLTFGYEVKDAKLKKFFLVYIFGSYYACTCVVSLLSFSMSVLWYRWSEVLSAFNERLRLGSFRKKSKLLKYGEFFDILNSLRNLEASVKALSFFFIVSPVQQMFIALFEILLFNSQHDSEASIAFTLQQVMALATSTFRIVAYVICCAKIPERLNEIKLSARDIVRKCGASSLVSRRKLFYLEKIGREDVFYVSACDMFYMSKSIILSVAGVILSYNFLIGNYVLSSEK